MAEWLCWHVGTTGDPKFTAVAKRAKVPKAFVISLWANLLERAKPGQGDFGKFDHEDAAITLDIEEKQIAAIMTALKEKGLISNTKITNWAKRQHNATSKERTRAWRERQRHSEALPPVSDVTVTSRNVTECLVTAQDRTGQDITKNISNTVPDTAREANGTNGHGHKNGIKSQIDLSPLRASRAFRPNGAYTAEQKKQVWEQNIIAFMRDHWPEARASKAIREYLDGQPAGKTEFEVADKEMRAAK